MGEMPFYVTRHVYHTKSVLKNLGSRGKMAGLSSVTLRPTDRRDLLKRGVDELANLWRRRLRRISPDYWRLQKQELARQRVPA
ncbi:hypothetical protein BC826DRAFT_1006949 [Russula brevipes]|nr:hypothetical protein BC826DRAFT_1006949 [Russula brevipes]